MAVVNLDFQVNARQPTQELKQFTRQTQQLEASVKGASERLRDANGRFIAAGQSAQQASTKVDLLNKAIGRLASQLVVADLARRFFKGFDEAERAAAAVRTLGVDSKVLEAQLLAVSNRLGGLYSQTQLVTAAYDVASAGFANAADAAKILEASAKGATGGLSDINTVGNAVTSVLNAYGKSANDAALLVDGFIQTQNDGKIILNEYAQQIGRLAPTAAAAGIGIKELNAAVSVITAQGVPVEATFTGLNQAIVSILKPTKEASDLAKALGIDFNEAGLRANGFGGLLKQVKEKTGGSTTALVQLFGSVDALKAVLPLVNDDLAKFNEFLDKQQKAAGVSDKATQELGGTVSSEITKMVNQIGNLVRAFDTVLGPVLGGVIKLINVIIAKATQGINVLGQLLSLSPNTTILKGALESGNLRGNAAPRVISGIDELIGERRRKQLQTQAGAGKGPLGLGFDPQKFAELLKKEPAIKQLLGTGTVSKPQGGGAQGLNPEIEELLKSLEQKQSRTKGTKKERESQVPQLTRELGLLQQQTQLQGLLGQAALAKNKEDEIRLQGIGRETELLYQALAVQQSSVPLQEKQLSISKIAQQLAQSKIQTAQELALLDLQQRETGVERIRTIEDENELLQARLLGNEAEVLLKQQIAQLTKDTKGLDEGQVKALLERNNALKQQVEAATQLKQLYADIGMSIKDGVVGAIQGAIDGTKSLQEVATNLLNNIANKLLDVAVNFALFGALSGTGIGGGLFGGLFKKRAMGGSVTAGQPYLVGERGPELFMPGRSGGIAPAGGFGGVGNVVVNVDAGGSSVQGDPGQANQLGKVIGLAVQQELIKQKRPGGLLA